MNNTFKVIDITNCTYEFFYYMINIENLDPNKITMKIIQNYFYLL